MIDKPDPTSDDDEPPLDAALIAKMTLYSRARAAAKRISVAEALAPPVPQDFEWEPNRSSITSRVPDLSDCGPDTTLGKT